MVLCAFLHLASLTLTDIRRARIELFFFFASNLFPQRSSWPHCDAFQSNSPSLSFARELSYSCLAAHFFQYTDRGTSIFLTSFGHTSHVNLYLSTKDQCVLVRPFHSQITGLTHHCSCRPSHLFPRLDHPNLPHPSFFLLVTPFSSLYSFCPVLNIQSGKLFFHF